MIACENKFFSPFGKGGIVEVNTTMYIGEIISVVACFGLPYKIRPVRFTWSGKLREVKDITYSWITREGRDSIYHFSVTDGNTLYEVSFNGTSLLWKLENLEA